METLKPQPHRIKNITHEFDTTIIKFENGNEQRFCNREEEIVGFKLTWYFLTTTEQTQLLDFFRARKGAFEPFWLKNHHENVGSATTYKLKATSASTLTIAASGSPISITTQANKNFLASQRVRLERATNPDQWMEGNVVSYSGTTLQVVADKVGGSGTFSNWNIYLADVGDPIYKPYKVRFKDDKLTTAHFNNRFAGIELEVIQCL
jgi:hypothetical protein